MQQYLEYDQVFTPAAPVSQRELLVGRDDDLKRLRRYLSRPGFHPVVIGDRGVGKTTLVKYALGERLLARVNCGKLTSFSSLVKATLHELGENIWAGERTSETKKTVKGGATPFGVGVETSGEHTNREQLVRVVDELKDPVLLVRYLSEKFHDAVLIYDEFDEVPKEAAEIRQALANMIKDLSDHSDRSRLKVVVVGVAKSIESLLGAHDSIKRCAKQIYLRSLSREAISSFLSVAERISGVTFHPTIKDTIASEANGFPYYAHLVGLSSLDAMKDRSPDEVFVTKDDFYRGKVSAAEEAFRELLARYRKKAYSLSRLEKAILFVIMGKPAGARLLQEVRLSCLDKFAISDARFNHGFRSLKSAHLVFLAGERIHFSDPLLEPFLRIQVGSPKDPAQLPLFGGHLPNH